MANGDNRPIPNLERLLVHLKQGSLAAQLAATQTDPGGDDPGEALKRLIRDRLQNVRAGFEQPSD